MSGKPIRVHFEVNARSDLGGVTEILPAIGGEPLMALIHTFEVVQGYQPSGAYGGIIPTHFRFGPLDEHYLGRSSERPGAKVPLLGCECGEWGCWPLLARIRATDDTVVWSEFEQPHRRQRDYTDFGPFAFPRAQYDEAITDLTDALERIDD